jgi:hypothetical protein
VGALLVPRPVLLGLASWLASLVALAAAIVLADFGAPAWVFIALGLWLATLGLPTLLAALFVFSAWGELPLAGTPPLGAALACVAAVSCLAQTGAAVLLGRWVRRRGAAAGPAAASQGAGA